MKTLQVFLLLLLISCAISLSASAQSEKITETFFKSYQKDPIKAYEELFSNNKWMKDKKSEMDLVKIQMESLLKGIGDYYGFELIAERTAGQSYMLKSFLVKYERQPIRITFLLYKPQDTWQVQNFSYDTSIEEESGEAAKLYRLKDNW